MHTRLLRLDVYSLGVVYAELMTGEHRCDSIAWRAGVRNQAPALLACMHVCAPLRPTLPRLRQILTKLYQSERQATPKLWCEALR